uniref:Serine/threonine-protein kinase ULK3 n=1 Tax=Clastoptera arizonana TaxID=38151 RepID=A0A1B6DXA2_9HEMI
MVLIIEGYTGVEKIGTGSYSTVYKGYHKSKIHEPVAIKCVEKSKLSPTGKDNIVTEISLLKMLQHEYIVEMKDFTWDERFIYIIMEYCDGGDLSHFIRKRRKLPESVCQKFMQQLAVALKFLRSHNVCHLDLKPQNLLLVTKPSLTLKVGDFGFAQFLSNETFQCTLRGSPLYMAPEMLIKRQYDAKVDLWSVGIIAYECLFGRAPYSSSNIKELQEKIKSKADIEIPENSRVSNDCRDLLLKLLQHNPEDRISFEALFAHPFLDLEHLPTPESHDKALKLINEAVKEDAKNDYKVAFVLYCDALKYLVPIVSAEKNLEKKIALKAKVSAYIRRAEELKMILHPNNAQHDSCKKTTLSSIDTVDYKSTTSLDSPSTKNLRDLCATTPNMIGALDIGYAGQMYLAEGQYKLALDKFEASLGVLVPLLATEPPGPRKDLLYKQIQDWLKQAESTKGLLSCFNMNMTSIAELEAAKDTCHVQ